ncbi:hypothetical protein L3X38_032852 [Prunus dulcis]|uniref:Reverse transcriptase domain-containing protein n=1 Tax=Prunus dulcis TaxID=3755 RepID=A0AAD4VEW5_PRUDU|nr:hypothetical protein L3X38_032852 [Prunus dulcis]
MLANRLKLVIPSIISDTHNAFVQGRQIQDNIVVAHEVYHYLRLKRKGSKFEASLKMDMSKAYDRVEWDFFRAVMAKMGFSNFWINLVMTCISSVLFSILLNGKPRVLSLFLMALDKETLCLCICS